MDFETLIAILSDNSLALGLSGALLSLTALAAKFLHPSKKESLALWLMGAQTEESWAKSFCDLFDALFGDNHLSWRCIWRSALASLVAVSLMFWLMGSAGLYGLRLEAGLSLWTVLGLAVAVNLVADYVSLLETRWLLGRLQHVRSFWLQTLALLADLVITGAIIWVAIWVITPLLPGQETTTFAETLGLFSVYSVLFYSTFLTSVWSWAYILSTWILRVFTRLKLHEWIVIDKKPVIILGTTLAALVFVSAKLIVLPLKPDETGLSLADRALCEMFPGSVCFPVSRLATVGDAKWEVLVNACEAKPSYCSEIPNELENALFSLGAACALDDAYACSAIGIYLLDREHSPHASIYFAQSCEGNVGWSCTRLGYRYELGDGVTENLKQAIEHYKVGCKLGDSDGCRAVERLNA